MPDDTIPTSLVNPDWVLAHLDDPAVRIVEVDYDGTGYAEGHLPGAVFWTWGSELTDQVTRDIVDRDTLTSLLSRSGIGTGTHIVLYGEDNWYAAWASWQLGLFGITQVSLVDGGRGYWLAHDLPLTTHVAENPPVDMELPPADFSTRIYAREIEERLGQPHFKPIDVRGPDEYRGQLTAPEGYPPIAQRAGHIPGAAALPWQDVLSEDGRFKPVAELRRQYASAGVTGDDDLFTYCGVGVRSSHSWFVLHRILGFPRVRNYDGSWAEWGSLVGVPIEKSVG